MLFNNPIWYLESRLAAGRLKRHGFKGVLKNYAIIWIWIVPNLIFLLLEGRTTWRDLGDMGALCAGLQIAYLLCRSLIAGAGVMTRERDMRLREILITTPLSPERVLCGKLAAVMLPLILECLVAVPFSAEILMNWRWVSPLAVLKLFGVSVASVLCFATLGMAAAASARSTLQGISTAVFSGILWCGLTWILDAARWRHLPYDLQTPLWCIVNPFAGFYSALGLPGYPWNPPESMWHWLWLWQSMLLVALAAGLARFTLRRLRTAEAT